MRQRDDREVQEDGPLSCIPGERKEERWHTHQGGRACQDINREEKYADADREPDNLIRVPKGSPPLLDGKAVYLYKSGFGDILNPPEGLRISGNASPPP